MKPLSLLTFALIAPALFAQTPIKFVNPVPSGYDLDLHLPQFVDVCPDITLPKGHVYFKPPTKQGWSYKQIMAKGVTHWDRHDAKDDPEGDTEAFAKHPVYKTKEYSGVPRISGRFSTFRLRWMASGGRTGFSVRRRRGRGEGRFLFAPNCGLAKRWRVRTGCHPTSRCGAGFTMSL